MKKYFLIKKFSKWKYLTFFIRKGELFRIALWYKKQKFRINLIKKESELTFHRFSVSISLGFALLRAHQIDLMYNRHSQ